ncbi:MAG: hypothetical protein WCI89_02035 [bacterium]
MSDDLKEFKQDIHDLVEIIGGIKEYIETKLVTKEELENELESKIGGLRSEMMQNFEMTNGKIEGVQRGLDSNFERHSALEARVSKIEEELHI